MRYTTLHSNPRELGGGLPSASLWTTFLRALIVWMPGTYAYGKQNDFENHQKLMFRCRLFWSCIDFRLNQFRERWVSAKISLSTFHHHYDICQLLFSHCQHLTLSSSLTLSPCRCANGNTAFGSTVGAMRTSWSLALDTSTHGILRSVL